MSHHLFTLLKFAPGGRGNAGTVCLQVKLDVLLTS